MKRKAGGQRGRETKRNCPGGLARRLVGLYPKDKKVAKAVQDLWNAGFKELNDLNNVGSDGIEALVVKALRQRLQSPASVDLMQDCTVSMLLSSWSLLHDCPGGIARHLVGMYPASDTVAQAVRDLWDAGFKELDDLKNVICADIDELVDALVLVALRQHLRDSASCLVMLNCTVRMLLSYIERTVKLRPENRILQLPEEYSPVSQDPKGVMREEAVVDEKDVVTVEDDIEDDPVQDDDDEQRTLPAPVGEELELQLFDYTSSSKMLSCVWGKGGSPKLLQRKHYLGVLERVNLLWRSGQSAVLLTGPPGIGKTAFLIFLMTHLMKAFTAFVFRTKGGEMYFYQPPQRGGAFSPCGIPVGYQCYRLTNSVILLNPEVYLLADGNLQQVPQFAGRALLAAAPLTDNYKGYEKDGRSSTVYLPVWSAAEIALAWQEVFDPAAKRDEEEGTDEEMTGTDEAGTGTDEDEEMAGTGTDGEGKDEDKLEVSTTQEGGIKPGMQNGEMAGTEEGDDEEKAKAAAASKLGLTLDVVKERYGKWGGTARFVLEKPWVDLDSIINSVKSIQQTVEAAGKGIAGDDHPSHKLVHMKVMHGYKDYIYMFASPYATERAIQKLKSDTSSNLRAFLTFKGLQAHQMNGLKGNILQREFKDLATGVKRMLVRQLYQDIKKKAKNREKLFNFGNAFKDLCQLPNVPASALPPNRIMWPASKIAAAFDALKIVRASNREDILELYQVSISSGRGRHGLNYKAVLEVTKQLGIPASRTRVYVATTSELFPHAGYQSWEEGDRVVTSGKVLADLEGVTQYALDIGI